MPCVRVTSFLFAMLVMTPVVELAASTPEMAALIKAAQAEGEVEVILSGQAPQKLRSLMTDFEKKYRVRVNFQTGSGSAHAQRILAERRVGRFTIDAWLGGANTALTQLIPNGALTPIAPLLIDPEVTDLSKWYRGRHYYVDPENKYVFAFGASPIHMLAINTKLVADDEIKSFWDLLNPRWKGKMVSWNPGSQGAGGSAVAMYLHPKIGEEWFVRLAREMDVTIVQDARQGAEWLAMGRFHIGIFGIGTQAESMRLQGFPVQGYIPRPMIEGDILNNSAANIMVMNQAPHPKAVQLFMNWLLTREVQQKLVAVAGRSDSLREDIDNSALEPAYKRDRAVDYYVSFVDPVYQNSQAEVLEKLRQIMRAAGYQ